MSTTSTRATFYLSGREANKGMGDENYEIKRVMISLFHRPAIYHGGKEENGKDGAG